jgi:glyoxylase-like metal-dependent hydrolase (beta-lactamase superfamily II)
MSSFMLAPGIEIYERGWLSANNIFHFGDDDVSIVDTGYHAHSKMTVDLVSRALKKYQLPRLNKVVNTHLHSDHCGGNAALLEQFDVKFIFQQLKKWLFKIGTQIF